MTAAKIKISKFPSNDLKVETKLSEEYITYK